MNPDVVVARTMLLVPVLLSAVLLMALVIVLLRGFRTMTKEGTPPGWMLQSAICICALQWIVLAGMDVGQFLPLFTENAGGIAMLAAVFFVPWMGMQTVKGWKSAKGNEVAQVGKDNP